MITVITDAAYCPDTSATGLAYCIITGQGRHYGNNIASRHVETTVEAEMLAMVVGLQTAVALYNPLPGETVFVQSDCVAAIDGLNGRRRVIRTSERQLSGLADRLIDERTLCVVYRHVKGHTKRKGARYVVQRACDKLAREAMKQARAAIMEPRDAD